MATDEKKKDPRSVLLKGVRLSFTESLREKKRTSDQSDKLSHGCNVILEKTSPNFEANKAKATSGMKAACDAKWKDPERYKTIQEDAPKRVCFRKGESFKSRSDNKPYAGYAGNLAITGKGPGAGDRRPYLIDRMMGILEGQTPKKGVHPTRRFKVEDIDDIFYGGSLADVQISFYGTEEGSDGVFCSIEMIRSHQEGERMGSQVELEIDELDELDDTTPDLSDGVEDDDDI